MTDELDIFHDMPAHLAGSDTGLVLTVRGGDDRLFVEGGQLYASVAGHMRLLGSSVDVVVVGAAEHTSRAYYKGDALKCYSKDGGVPNVEEPQATSCRSCPQNQAGSRITNGRKAKACGYFHRFAVALVDDLQGAVLSLDVRTTSLFGTSVTHDNRYSMKGYTEFLARKGVGVDKLVTRISLDEAVDYAKLLFSPARFVREDERLFVQELIGSEEVQARLVVQYDDVEVPQESASSTGLFLTT